MDGFQPPAAMKPDHPAGIMKFFANMLCRAMLCRAVLCCAGCAAHKRRSGPPPVKASPLTPSSATRGLSDKEEQDRKLEQGKRYKETNRKPDADDGDAPAAPDDGWERLEDYKDLSMDGEDGGTHTEVQWGCHGLFVRACSTS